MLEHLHTWQDQNPIVLKKLSHVFSLISEILYVSEKLWKWKKTK